ncbi:MAG: hypothetical protein ACPHE0_03650, partial [Pseudomonadales bacterium]
YTAGWIKRGPTGVIGTNKTCAQETVNCMVEDLAAGNINEPADPSVEGVKALVNSRQSRAVSYDEWLNINEVEVSRGEAAGRPRIKFTNIDEMVEVARSGSS